MKRALAVASLVAVAATVACKTTNSGSAVKDQTGGIPPGAQGFPAPMPQPSVQLSLSGAPAKAVYDAASWEADASGQKRFVGAIEVACTMTGALPPGAQGFPGQIKYQCSATTPWPEGAQGFPGPAFFIVEGQAAAKFWAAFKPQSKYQGDAGWYIKKHKSDNGEFKCTESECTYTADVAGGGGNDGGGIPPGAQGFPPPAPQNVFLSLSGPAAKAVYDAASWEADENGTKSQTGQIEVSCTMQGALPPGAQGFPGQITYQCSAAYPFPEGAQGFPGPAFFIVEGDAAVKFWSAFKVQDKWQAEPGWYLKKKVVQNGEFKCTKAGDQYACTAR